MTTITETSFPSLLNAARQFAGMSMQELATKSAISKQAISKFESGHIQPSSETLNKLSEALGVSHDYFFSNQHGLQEIQLDRISLREEDKIDGNEFENIKLQTIDYLIRLLELEKLNGVRDEFKNPVADLEIRTKKDAEKAAKRIRKKWGLGNVPIGNVVELLEANGVKVFDVEQSVNFEGFSAWAGKIPIIVINSLIKEVTRLRFTALHELGHIVLEFIDDLTNAQIERLCDAFSGELLFPSEVIVMEVGTTRTKFSMVELKHLKLKYGISIQAILYSAYKTGVLDTASYRNAKNEYSKWVDAKRDLGTFDVLEKPQRFHQMIFSSLAENKISIGRAAHLSKMKEGDFKKRYNKELQN